MSSGWMSAAHCLMLSASRGACACLQTWNPVGAEQALRYSEAGPVNMRPTVYWAAHLEAMRHNVAACHGHNRAGMSNPFTHTHTYTHTHTHTHTHIDTH